MKYKLFQKQIGINASQIGEFDIPHKIVAFSAGDNVLYFLTENLIYAFRDKEIKCLGFEFEHASSIQWHDGLKSLFVTDSGGRRFYRIIDERTMPASFFDASQIDFMAKKLDKLDTNIHAQSVIDYYGNAYIVVKEAHRIFFKSYSFSDIKCLIGNGFATYGQSYSPSSSSLNSPSSVDVYGRHLIIADTGNNVIRSYNGGPLSLVAGHPRKKTISPSQIVCTKDFIYFTSNNNVYTLQIKNPKHNGISVFGSKSEVIIAKTNIQDSNNIYILEGGQDGS